MHAPPARHPSPPPDRVPGPPPVPRAGPWTSRAAFLQIPIGVCQFLPVMALFYLPLLFMAPVAIPLAFIVAALPFVLQRALRRGNGAAVFVLLICQAVTVALAVHVLSQRIEIAHLRNLLLAYLPFGLVGVLSLLVAEIEIFRAGRT